MRQTSSARWCLVLLLGLGIGLTASACRDRPRTYRVGILSANDVFAASADGFKAGLAELGYVEGRNVTYLQERTNFEPAAERRILSRFVDEGVDLIFVFPTEASLRAKAATHGTAIPVVFASATVEGVDLVASVRVPGGNLTGVRYPGPAIAVKRLEVLHDLAPRARRIWVPYQRGYVTIPSQLEALRPAAAAAGLTLVEYAAADASELRAYLDTQAALKDVGFDAILIVSGPLALSSEGFEAIGRFALPRRMPVGGVMRTGGGYTSLFGVAVDHFKVGRQASALADKVLRGISAGTIPVESPEVAMEISLSAATALGLAPREGLLREAARVVR